MKKILILLLIPIGLFGQNLNSDSVKIRHAMDSLGIKLNRPKTPEGFKLYYNCDSAVFFKKIHGDTITILTQTSMTPMSYDSEYQFNSFSYYLPQILVDPLIFPTKFHIDGRIEVVTYGPTIFIYRNDSLFMQDKDEDKFVENLIKITDKYLNGKIDSTTMEHKISIARKKYQPILSTCFIFTKKMFDSQSTVSIPLSLNPNNERVTLERKWKKKGVNCYLILIEGYYKEIKTEVRYTFDENINFINWQDCE